nr:integrase, catalytic region, zinc finger, CCHC-type, peptidase aspartic, catalytic [Tanacetum cinerariifolium]
MGTFRETLAEGDEGALHLGPERHRVYSNLSLEEKGRNQATVQDDRVVVQNVQGRLNRGQGNNAREQPKQPHNSEYFKDKMLLMQAQENGVALDEEQLLFITGGQDNVDDDVDEQPVHELALNVDNVFQANECDAFDSDVDEAPTAHTVFMKNLSFANPVYDEAGPSYDSDILSECVSVNAHTKVVDASLTAELAIYREQIKLYERRAKFELTEREQTIEEQLRIVITNRNIKEENLKKELHSVKMQLNSTINHNKSMVEEVTSLKKDFKQKENKYLEELFDMKALKEKVEDRLFKQDQSLQTVHMLCKLKPHYDEQRKIAIGYKNPFYLSKAKQVQPALYSGPKIVKSNHARVLVHDSEDTLEIAETTRKQMNEKIKDPECVKKKDLIKMKAEALKEQTSALRPIKALTVNNREVHLDYLKHLKENVTTFREIVEEARAVRPLDRVKSYTDVSGSKPRSNTKKNKISPAKSVNQKKAEEHLRTNKSSSNRTNHVDSSISSTRTVVQIVFWYLDSGCSKHMTRDRSRLRNFVKKFIGTVRFGNDHFGAIMGYGDYVIGDNVIYMIYYVEGLGHNLFSVGKFCDSDLEVAFRKHSCYVRDTDGVELIKDSHGSNLYTISVKDMLKSSPICLFSRASKNKSWLWHRHLNHLNFDTINDLARKDLVRGLPRLTFEKAHLCSACQLGKSKKHTHKPKAENTNLEKRLLLLVTPKTDLSFTRHNKTPYELAHDKKDDLAFLRVFGALCYTINDSEDLGKLQPMTDIGIFVGYPPSRKGYRIYNKRTRCFMETIHVQFDELTEAMDLVQLDKGFAPSFLTPRQISSGLVPNPIPAAPYVLVISASTPSSTTIDQDSPSPSNSPSSSELQPHILHQSVTVGSTIIEDNHFAPVDNDPFVNVFAPKPNSEASSSGDASSAESTHITQPHNHLKK